MKQPAQIRNPRSAVLNHAAPIIAMTANAVRGDREKCLQAGMNDYMAKPASLQTLADVLEKWLPNERDAGDRTQDARQPESVEKASCATPPVWDKAGMLKRIMDNEKLAGRLVEIFLSDIPQRIQSLEQALETSDVTGVVRQAHTIKGSSANVGGEALRALALEMEKAAKGGDLNAVRTRMNDLRVEFHRLQQAMEEGVAPRGFPALRHGLHDRAQIQPPLFQWSPVGDIDHVRHLLDREGGQLAFGQTHEHARRRTALQLRGEKVNAMGRQPGGQNAVERRGVAALLNMAQHRLAHIEQDRGLLPRTAAHMKIGGVLRVGAFVANGQIEPPPAGKLSTMRSTSACKSLRVTPSSADRCVRRRPPDRSSAPDSRSSGPSPRPRNSAAPPSPIA
jgi:HPt (histidine-containing phosphotransfer) domain-containing protein